VKLEQGNRKKRWNISLLKANKNTFAKENSSVTETKTIKKKKKFSFYKK